MTALRCTCDRKSDHPRVINAYHEATCYWNTNASAEEYRERVKKRLATYARNNPVVTVEEHGTPKLVAVQQVGRQ